MTTGPTDAAVAFAKTLFNRAWDRLERTDRSPEDDRAMLADALGSWALWREVNDPRRHAVSDWQVSRVFAVLGDPVWAGRYAAAGLERCETHRLGPFLEGYAWEAEARAAHLAGDPARRDAAIAAARAAADRVEDPDERQLIIDDLAELEDRRAG